MDKILFGDNQFFAVNHISDEKSRAQSIKFKEDKTILDTIDISRNLGVETFMCTTHDRIYNICDMVRAEPDKYSKFSIYPCMPYAHKYANAVTELGIMGTIKNYVPGNFFGSIFKGGMAFVSKDYISIMELLIDAEMKMFEGLKTPVIFLQNVVVDLLLGMGMKEALRIFANHVKTRYNAEPGFITMNLPMLLDVLDELGIANPIVCSNINKIGFRMSGGMNAYEKALRERKFRAVAMSVFASGAIPPKEAIEWVCQLPNIESIVFGASSRGNIRNTKELVDWASTSGFNSTT